MSQSQDSRRMKESKLDIDRRQKLPRRDMSRRQALDVAYESIYIPTYVNAIYPKFPVNVHAFSNDMHELSQTEWAVVAMALEHAKAGLALAPLKDFARKMIDGGFIANSQGENVVASKVDYENLEMYRLKTGT